MVTKHVRRAAWGMEMVVVNYPPLTGFQWALVGAGVAGLALVVWEAWEAKIGNERPALRVAIGIMFLFFAGVNAERGLLFFRSGRSTHKWMFEVLLNVVCLLVSIFYFFKRKEPRTFIEWLNERAKPPLMFGKKED